MYIMTMGCMHFLISQIHMRSRGVSMRSHSIQGEWAHFLAG